MPLLLSQLRSPITEAQALDRILAELQALGFNATSWQEGSMQRTFVAGLANIYALLTTLVDGLSRQVFNDSAANEGLTEFSDSHYDNQRVVAVSTAGLVRLTDTGTGPHTIAVSQVVVRALPGGQRYRNITGGTVPLNSFVALTFQAETPGTAGNVANNTITEMATPIAGVTVNNPDPGSGTWITTLGIDEEEDDRLRERNTTKWATLSYAQPAEGLENAALNADTDVTRTLVDDDNPRGPGTVDLYIARATGAATAGDVTTVQGAIDGTTPVEGAQVRPVTSDVLVVAAPTQTQNLTATVHVTTSLNTAAKQAEIEQAATDYINSLPIGGEVLPSASQGVVVFSELVGAVTAVVGVRRVNFTVPTADVNVALTSVVVVGTITFTYVNID